jgi:lysylphosphatidylglycerol synthetase-like protein (DUF2156 family)
MEHLVVTEKSAHECPQQRRKLHFESGEFLFPNSILSVAIVVVALIGVTLLLSRLQNFHKPMAPQKPTL